MTTFFRSLLAISLLMLGMMSNAQPFQNTAGTPQNDAYWGGLTIANGYIAVGTTQNNLGGNDLLLTQYNVNGTVAWSRVINIPSSSTASVSRLEPRDITAVSADAPIDPTVASGGYFITGFEVGPSPNFPGNMFVLRVDNIGNIVWFRTNIVPTLNIQQSEGVSVVAQPDGGVIAVGNAQLVSTTPGTVGSTWIIAARFSATGVLAWSRIYGSPTLAGSNLSPTYKAHEATYNYTACANTTLNGGVVIAGEVANEAIFTSTATGGSPGPHLLAMTIDGTGTECWRSAYPAYTASPNVPSQSSVGYDITYNASLSNYILVGKAQSASTALPTPYIVRINPTGLLVCSSLMNLPNSAGAVSNWFARGVTNSFTTGRVVIVGPNVTSNRTYAAEINVSACPFTLVWDKEYPLSTANVTAVAGISGSGIPENITQTNSTAATNGGYFITTNKLTGLNPLLDTHVMCTNAAGGILAACPPIEVQSSLAQLGMRIELTPNSIEDASWNSLAPLSTALTLTSVICNEQPACIVTAGFTFTQSGNIVTFTNTSTGNGTLSYSWSFGDGSGSTNTNPTHTYTSAGTYNVCLTVTNTMPDGTTCTQIICQTIVINLPTTCTATPNFCVTLNNNIATFANSSTGNGTLSYLWEFGDGTTSTAANPSKSYPTTGGTFTVCLTVTTTLSDGTKCCQKCCKTITINPTCTASANFRFTVNGTAVSFTNTSATGQTYLWTFGNGNTSTAFTPPTQSYAPGTYQVCLEATKTNTIGSCSKTVCKTIVIDPPCNLIARFRPTICLNSNTVIFTNFSIINTTAGTPSNATYLWDFGDGSTSTDINPSHTYTTAGTYTVCLNISSNNNTCRGRVCQVISVTPSVCNNNCTPSMLVAPNEEGYQDTAYKSLNTNSDLQIVPNPADDIVWISLPEKVSEGQLIEVFDLQGKLVASTTAAATEMATELSVRNLPKGMYFVTVSDNDGKVYTNKLVKE